MTAKWGSCAFLAVLFVLVIGCRSSQPDVKPGPAAERYAVPPPEGRYESPGYPKAAYDAPVDPIKRALETKGTPASMGRGGGMPGMGASRGN